MHLFFVDLCVSRSGNTRKRLEGVFSVVVGMLFAEACLLAVLVVRGGG